ncbi:MAG TPA: hypothetical protein VFM18_12870, partial [Methanosarcina sp.]|nr:hypothetical protein [Methanosarcina sp.]
MSLTIETKTITPELAEVLLENNISNNRKLKEKLVKKYVQDILSDNWCISDALKFDKNGNLIDGQHRLHAVIAANKAVKFAIVRNYEPEAAQVLDIGCKRTASDIAALQGKNISPKIFTVLRNLIMSGSETANSTVQQVTTEHDLIALYELVHNEIDYALELR